MNDCAGGETNVSDSLLFDSDCKSKLTKKKEKKGQNDGTKEEKEKKRKQLK